MERAVRGRKRCLVGALFMVSLSAAELGGADTPANHRPELRKAALAGFTYDNGSVQAPVAPESSKSIPSSPDPDAVVMDKVEVTSRYLDKDLDSAITRFGQSGPRSSQKLGTGVVEKNFGRARMSAATMFYVPINIGLSW
jgi:hypothetical protein